MNVLLIEDDPGIGRFVTRGLTACGYRVAWERDGSRALEMLTDDGFNVALIDLGLPDCDGLDLCRSLRSAGGKVPVLMLTARGALQDRLDGFAAGADDYLPKPFAFDELVARLNAIVKRGSPAAIEGPRFDTLSMDASRGMAKVGEDNVPLSRREFALLSALVAQGGAVVTRSALAEAVWESEEVSDNALDVYVSYVRRRLAQLPGAPIIATARGVGFRLVPAEPVSSQSTRAS